MFKFKQIYFVAVVSLDTCHQTNASKSNEILSGFPIAVEFLRKQPPHSTLRENCSLVVAASNSCRSGKVISKAITAAITRKAGG